MCIHVSCRLFTQSTQITRSEACRWVPAPAWIQIEWLRAAAFKLPSMGLTQEVFPDPGVPLPVLGVNQVPCGSLRNTWTQQKSVAQMSLCLRRCESPVVSVSISRQVFQCIFQTIHLNLCS